MHLTLNESEMKKDTVTNAYRMQHSKEWGNTLCQQATFLRSNALRFTHDPYLAEDLMQDVLLLALQHEHHFDGQNLRAWLATLTKNVYINQYRREVKKGSQVDVSDLLYDSGLLANSVVNTGPGDLTRQDFMRYIDNLTPSLRSVAVARMKGYKYEEIAELTNVPMGTVRSILFRIRNMLPSPHHF